MIRTHAPRLLAVIVGLWLTACMCKSEPVAESRYDEPDKLFEAVAANVGAQAGWEVIVDIDHSRLAAEVGSTMPPAHVLIWSDPELDAAILKHNPLAAVDLPLRVLAYEDAGTGKAAVIANSYDFVAQRYALPDDAATRARYDAALGEAMKGLPDGAIASFESDAMANAGMITLSSTHGFEDTKKRILDAIAAQSDAVMFGTLDFAARSAAHGVTLDPTVLVLFGAPGPGGKAMASAPTLGLDGFCQKLLIWQDARGTVHVSFNDLLALAERQKVPTGLPLRVINYRLNSTFESALED